jgi:ribonuclease HII
MDIYQHDRSFRKKGVRVIAGMDEAGRGPIAGPVVAASVILPEDLTIEGLRDSKKVPEKERETLFWDVLSLSIAVGVGIADHKDIDRINILQATKLAMQRAFEDLSIVPDLLIIDALALPSLSVKQVSLIKADAKSAAVAASSIIAKYVRDRIMVHYHELYPKYGFNKHKGYCTQEHLDMVNLYGPCPIHRKTFKKVVDPELPF